MVATSTPPAGNTSFLTVHPCHILPCLPYREFPCLLLRPTVIFAKTYCHLSCSLTDAVCFRATFLSPGPGLYSFALQPCVAPLGPQDGVQVPPASSPSLSPRLLDTSLGGMEQHPFIADPGRLLFASARGTEMTWKETEYRWAQGEAPRTKQRTALRIQF